MIDPTGHGAIEVIGGIWGAALAEPTPFGEIIAAIATIFLGGVIIGEAISNSSSASSSSASAKPKAEAAKSTTIPIDTKIKAQNNPLKRKVEKAMEKAKAATEATTITVEKKPPWETEIVYRVYGGGSHLWGRSWTPVDPRTVKNYRDAAGLPSGGMSGSRNTGEYLAIGILHDKTGVKSRLALPLDGNSGGGIIEYEVPCPEMQITIIKIDILDPPL